MSKREIIGALVIFVLTGALGVMGGKMMGTYERGEEANIEDQIAKVLDEKLKTTIGGETKSLPEAVSLIHSNQVRMEETLRIIVE